MPSDNITFEKELQEKLLNGISKVSCNYFTEEKAKKVIKIMKKWFLSSERIIEEINKVLENN